MLESVLNIFKRTKNSNNIENKNLKFSNNKYILTEVCHSIILNYFTSP